MSWRLLTPPGTCSTIRSISPCVSFTSGSSSGVIRSTSPVIRFAGAALPRCSGRPPTGCASSVSLGAENSVRTSTPKPAARIRSSTLTASNEWPPSSKKLSCRPTRSSFNTSCQICATTPSVPPCGASYDVAEFLRRAHLPVQRQRLALALAVEDADRAERIGVDDRGAHVIGRDAGIRQRYRIELDAHRRLVGTSDRHVANPRHLRDALRQHGVGDVIDRAGGEGFRG